jgi:6-pyruvoyl-tetrahydropterin synthase
MVWFLARSVTRELIFKAHQLLGVGKKNEYLHGHTWVTDVYIKGEAAEDGFEIGSD